MFKKEPLDSLQTYNNINKFLALASLTLKYYF